MAGDAGDIASLSFRLWPHGTIEEHREEIEALLAGRPQSTLPLVIFVAEADGGGGVIAFLEVGLRSHADGCDPSRPVGFVEGWYVAPEHRGRGVGRALMERAEAWAVEQGCVELGSDTWIDNPESVSAHVALGFEVVDRCVNMRKPLVNAAVQAGAAESLHYGSELAHLHHHHFGMVARAAGHELIDRLSRRGLSSGTVVDLAAGTGILARHLTGSGYAVCGVDISPHMLGIARAEAPAATWILGSLWSAELPPGVVAVTAIGEAFNYAVDPVAGPAALEARLAAIHHALAPGGLLLFDVAGPGRSGPGGSRRSFWTQGDTCLGLEEREDPDGPGLTRRITLFVRNDGLYRRVDEEHRLRLYAPEQVEAALAKAGFTWERLDRYHDFALMPGWSAYVAVTRGG